MEPDGLLLCSQEPSTGPSPEPDYEGYDKEEYLKELIFLGGATVRITYRFRCW
jgi:hypothetical protein